MTPRQRGARVAAWGMAALTTALLALSLSGDGSDLWGWSFLPSALLTWALVIALTLGSLASYDAARERPELAPEPPAIETTVATRR